MGKWSIKLSMKGLFRWFWYSWILKRDVLHFVFLVPADFNRLADGWCHLERFCGSFNGNECTKLYQNFAMSVWVWLCLNPQVNFKSFGWIYDDQDQVQWRESLWTCLGFVATQCTRCFSGSKGNLMIHPTTHEPERNASANIISPASRTWFRGTPSLKQGLLGTFRTHLTQMKAGIPSPERFEVAGFFLGLGASSW